MVKLSQHEFFPLLNILNEVCHGFYIPNFENTIGAPRKTVVDFMDKLAKNESKENIIIDLNDFELFFLQKSFIEVFKEIEEWEFQTRIGITIEEAKVIENKIAQPYL